MAQYVFINTIILGTNKGQIIIFTVHTKVILETVSGLVSVWKTGIEWSRSVVLDLVLNNISHLQSKIVGLCDTQETFTTLTKYVKHTIGVYLLKSRSFTV